MHRESNSRLLAEEALDESRERLQLSVEAAGLALWDWYQGSPQVFMTARWAEMIGDVVMDGYWNANALRERIHPEDLPAVQAAVEALAQGRTLRLVQEHRVRGAEGWIWVESHGIAAEHDARGRPLRLMGTLADISARKRVEAEIQAARDMAEQASRAKSEFLANTSHEFRTPLNALIGLTRLLMDSPINAEQRQWLTLMDSSAHALLNMLNDVLDFSRIEAGKMGIERVRFDLPRLLEETGALYEGQAREKAIQWTQSLAPDLPSAVTGDPGRLRQVLGNLLSNALKFTPAGGHVRLSASTGTDQGGGRVLRLRVQDDGVGIARAHQAKIFEAFTQADSSTARRFGGSGLGLAICARLVRLMGGHIDLDSEPGRGSVFTVTLPLDGTDPASGRVLVEEGGGDAAAMQATGKRFDGKVVLVAEDNPVNELLINQWLQRLGCVVRNARDGEEALAQWEAGPVDLVLMDVQMPRVNGLEAVRRIRERERRALLRPTPVVALTANAMSGDREACLAAGMDAYLSKPVTPESLAQAMAQVLRQDAVGGRAPQRAWTAAGRRRPARSTWTSCVAASMATKPP